MQFLSNHSLGRRDGFGLVEAVFALVIITMVMGGAYSLLSQSHFMTAVARDHYQAVSLAHNTLERIKNLPVQDMVLMEESNVRIDQNGNKASEGMFRRTIEVEDGAVSGVVQVTVTVEIINRRNGDFDGKKESVTTLLTDFPDLAQETT